MPNAKVLVSDKLSEEGLAILRAAPSIDVDYRPGLPPDELLEVIGGYHGLIIRSGTKVKADVIARADNLKVIGRAGIGVDNVDVPAASKRGIVVMNTPTGNAVTTAEHALSLLLSLARKIPEATASMRAGKWEKNKFQGREISDKTLGIVGLGNIGRIVADRAQGLKMQVIALDPIVSPEQASRLGVTLVSFDELLARSDFITIHAPLTDETRSLFDDSAFERVKPSLLLVNAARGGIVDELALARALKAGKLAGAAIDVYVKEPPPPDHLLLSTEHVVLTPHLGASTGEAQNRVAVEIAEQVVAFLRDGTVKNAVNMPSLPADVAERVAPYQRLGRALGLLVAQLPPVGVRELRVTCTGEAGELGVAPIAHAVAAGFLAPHSEVNYLSAPYEAKERGIHLVEVREQATRGHGSTVRVTVTGDKGIHTATGTLGPDAEQRLINLQGYDVDVRLGGVLLLIRNQDRPGVIGAVGTRLGQSGINVSRVQVGLDESSGEALAVWNVDSDVPADVLDALRALSNVSSVQTVKL